MPSDQPRQNQQGWRGGAGKAGPGGGQRHWQKPAAKAEKKPWSRRSKLLMVTGAIGVVAAVLAVVVLFPEKIRPSVLVLIGSGYEENLTLPQNALGWKGMMDLKEVAVLSGTKDRFVEQADKMNRFNDVRETVGSDVADWDKLWAEVLKNKVQQNTFVLFLALHGASDANGPFLYLNDPRGQARLPIKHVLKGLQDDKLKDTNKVLILDATQVTANWPTGQLHNDFVYQLKEMKDEINAIPNLVVLCASDADQRSWVSEDWQSSIFAHYLLEGLKGAAVPEGGQRVTVWDLHKYVEDRVRSWAQANRRAEQTPILLGDKDTAQKTALVVLDRKSETPSPATPTPNLTADLEKAWQTCRELRDKVPAPYVYAPLAWRRYQETLIRWEQLERAGDPTQKAPTLKKAADDLLGQIKKASQLDVATESLGNTLLMPDALGLERPWNKTDLDPVVKKLWKSDGDQRTKAWPELDSLSKRADTLGRVLLQLDLTRLLLEDATRPENAGQLEKAPDLVEFLSKKLGSAERKPALSAEAHALTLLLRDQDKAAPKPPPAELLQKALLVRLVAEEVALAAGKKGQKDGHPYSERVQPLVHQKDRTMDDADNKRREAQDWLVASDDKDWSKAGPLLDEAKKGYEAVGKKAAQVRKALAVRDRLMDETPFLAQWAAGLGSDSKDRDVRLREAEELARVRQKFVKELPYIYLPSDQALSDKFIDSVAETEKKLNDLREKFDENCASLKEVVDNQEYWRAIDNVLAVPLLSGTQRVDLVGTHRGVSANLNRKAAGGAIAGNKDQAKDALDAAQRQAIALLLLDPTPDDAQAKEGMLTTVKVAVAATWRNALKEASFFLATGWLDQRDQANAQWDKSLAQVEISKALLFMGQADKNSRDLPAGLAATLPDQPFGPAEGMRYLRTAGLLVWQAERSVDDHWYGYYKQAGLAWHKDAAKLSQSKRDDADLARRREDNLLPAQIKARLEPAGIDDSKVKREYHVTSELEFAVPWNLLADKGTPKGVAMVRTEIDPDGPISFAKFGGAKADAKKPPPRAPLFVGQKEGDSLFVPPTALRMPEVEEAKDPGLTPKVETGRVKLKGLYRGQQFEPVVNLRIQPIPDTVVYMLPPPEMAHVGFRMDKSMSFGAVSIVLDFSGSMNKLVPNAGKKRVELALEALREVLDKIPDNTYLSICAFSQKQQLVGNRVVGKNIPFEWLRGPEKWNTQETDQLMRKVKALAPGYTTPLAETMARANQEGFPSREEYNGPKILVALTDGDDSEFGPGIPAFLTKQFTNKNVEANVICFLPSDDDESREARKNADLQFSFVKDLDPPGLFLKLESHVGLAEILEKSIQPKVRLTSEVSKEAAKGFGGQGIIATRHGLNPDPKPIPAGLYRANVGRLGWDGDESTVFQRMRFFPGDRLTVNLKRVGGQIVFERSLFGDDRFQPDVRSQWQAKGGSWLATVFKNTISTDAELKQLIALEDYVQLAVKPTVELQQLRPYPDYLRNRIWIEAMANGLPVAGGMRWHPDYSYAAPVLELRVGDWTVEGIGQYAKPDLKIWISPEGAVKGILAGEHRRDSGAVNATFGDKIFYVNDAKVTIENATVETRYITRTPGPNATLEKAKCLVVRLQHEPGQPVFVEPLDLGYEGAELQFHKHANKATAIFWGVNNPEVEPFRLNLVPVEALKRSEPLTLKLRPPTLGN